MEQRVTFASDGLELSGILHTPDDAGGERRPVVRSPPASVRSPSYSSTIPRQVSIGGTHAEATIG